MLPEGEAVPGNGRKRLPTDEDEDGNAKKRHRINEEEAGPMEIDEQNGNQGADGKEDGNQESEAADGNEGNNNGEEDKKAEETEKTEGSGSNFNHQNSEESETGNQDSGNESGNQESGTEQSETGNQNPGGEEGKEDDGKKVEKEERRRRAAEKGKQPTRCILEPIVAEFSGEFQHGESSATLEDEIDGDIDEHRDLAILRSLWNFKHNNGYLPHPPSDEVLMYVMKSIPNYKLVKEYLMMKIMEFEHNFKDLIQMDGDNPFSRRQIHKEALELCKRLWGNQPQQLGGNQPQQQHPNQQQRLQGNQQQQLGDNQQQQQGLNPQQIAVIYLVCYVAIAMVLRQS